MSGLVRGWLANGLSLYGEIHRQSVTRLRWIEMACIIKTAIVSYVAQKNHLHHLARNRHLLSREYTEVLLGAARRAIRNHRLVCIIMLHVHGIQPPSLCISRLFSHLLINPLNTLT